MVPAVNRASQKTAAALLAALATFGLAIAPVLHADLHARGHAVSKREALAVLFQLASKPQLTPDQRQALEEAYAAAFPGAKNAAPHQHDSRSYGGHSHGGGGAHGSGALEHLGLAIGSAASPPVVTPPKPLPRGRLLASATLLTTPRYSTPEQSQAPPQA